MAYKYVDISVDAGSLGNTPFKVSFVNSDGQVLGTLFKGLNEKITQDDLDKLVLGLYEIPTSAVGQIITQDTSITCEAITTPEGLAEIDWVNIIQYANNGLIPISCIGAEKTITIGSTSYNVVLIGVNHDDLVSGGKANTTWQLKNLYNTKYQMNSSNTNSGGYASSAMHTTHLPSIFNNIQSDVRNAIKPIVKKASAGSQSSSIVNTNCNLFLLSEIEIFGEIKNSASGEGTQYVYWQQHDNYDDRRKGLQSSPTDYNYWWVSSPFVSDFNSFCVVGSDGGASARNASSSYGVSFAFCI